MSLSRSVHLGLVQAPARALIPAPGKVPSAKPASPPWRLEWPRHPRRRGEPVRLRDRWCFPAVFLISLLVFVSTDTGRTIFDTKLGVDIDAAGFLTRLWQRGKPL